MHKDEMKGAAKTAKGSMKEAAGKLTGDEELRAEGAADKTAGKIQKGVGNIKEAARKALEIRTYTNKLGRIWPDFFAPMRENVRARPGPPPPGTPSRGRATPLWTKLLMHRSDLPDGMLARRRGSVGRGDEALLQSRRAPG